MASGRQVAEANVQAFVAWKTSKSDDDFRSLVHRGQLSRKEVAIECGFAKSVLDQNPVLLRTSTISCFSNIHTQLVESTYCGENSSSIARRFSVSVVTPTYLLLVRVAKNFG